MNEKTFRTVSSLLDEIERLRCVMRCEHNPDKIASYADTIRTLSQAVYDLKASMQ